MIPLADPFCRAWFRYQSNTQIDFSYHEMTVLHFCGSSGLSGAQRAFGMAVNGEIGEPFRLVRRWRIPKASPDRRMY
jgi:hypothetical protein